MSKDTGGPAFPIVELCSGDTIGSFYGMTLRDYFAAKALVVIADMAAKGLHDIKRANGTAEQSIASDAYALADAMLAERAK